MTQNIIAEDLIFIGPEISTFDAAGIILFLCERMMEKGIVDSNYSKAVMERENRFPTGLPTQPYAIALPHAEPRGVKETAIALAVLKEPLKFRAMDFPDKYLDVRLVLLLAVAESSFQITMLQWISTFVQDRNIVASLVEAKTPHDVKKILDPLIEKNLMIQGEENQHV
jgi:PTS system galactitol-specific IIA component